MKQLILAAAFVLTATSAAFAQYGAPGYGYYDAVPGYSYNAAPGYSYYYGAALASGVVRKQHRTRRPRPTCRRRQRHGSRLAALSAFAELNVRGPTANGNP